MAVIITDMDMPKACCTQIEVIPGYCISVFCKLYECCPNKDIYNVNTKPKDCPCKSVDEMDNEIADVYVGYRHAYEVKADILDIIHKYTDKEDKCEKKTNKQ